jgi:hypothetical protein
MCSNTVCLLHCLTLHVLSQMHMSTLARASVQIRFMSTKHQVDAVKAKLHTTWKLGSNERMNDTPVT